MERFEKLPNGIVIWGYEKDEPKTVSYLIARRLDKRFKNLEGEIYNIFPVETFKSNSKLTVRINNYDYFATKDQLCIIIHRDKGKDYKEEIEDIFETVIVDEDYSEFEKRYYVII